MTGKKIRNINLKQPIRIQVIKSPMIINFHLYQVGVSNLPPPPPHYMKYTVLLWIIFEQYVPSYVREEVVNRLNPNRKLFQCRDYWYETVYNTNCGFAEDDAGNKIFDSQVRFCENCHTCELATLICSERGEGGRINKLEHVFVPHLSL